MGASGAWGLGQKAASTGLIRTHMQLDHTCSENWPPGDEPGMGEAPPDTLRMLDPAAEGMCILSMLWPRPSQLCAAPSAPCEDIPDPGGCSFVASSSRLCAGGICK